MKKQAIMPVLVLTIICIVVAALLGGVNELTKDKIAQNALRKEQQSLREVLPGSDLFEEIIAKPDGTPKTIKTIYRETNSLGYVFIVIAPKTDYSSGDMTISIGVSDGKITGAKITSYNESRDVGKNSYPGLFVGKTEDDYANVDTVAGVTYSSKAFKSAIGDALTCAKLLANEIVDSDPITPPDDTPASGTLDETLTALVPGASFELAYTSDLSTSTLKKLYSVSSGGYVAHIVVPGAYVPVATEALVYVNAEGTIANINLLQWIVGHDVVPGDFANGFIGADNDSIEDVDLVAGATGTSLDFKNAVTSAFAEIENIDHALALIPEDSALEKATIPSMSDSTLSGLYAVSTGGYVAHIIVPGAYVPVATEAVIYVNGESVVKAINLLQWVVGHGVEPGDFANGFIGTDNSSVGDVDIVAGATGTANDFKNAATAALEVITHLNNVSALVPDADFEETTIPADADSTLKHLYTVSTGGYIAHIVVPGAYVPVATEGLVYVADGKIKSIALLHWVVGHDVEPGDFANGFIGTDNGSVGNVDIVAGATGTANDFKNSVTAAVTTITYLENLNSLVSDTIIEEINVPSSADSTLKHLYTISTGGYIAHIVVPGAYVPVATEALIYVDAEGKIANINLIQWIVGHGVEPGNFADGFIGADNSSVGDVDIVAGATGTANDFKNAATAALEVITHLNNVSALVPDADFEETTIPADADSTLKHLYTVSTGGYIAHIVVPGAYVPVATEALIYVDTEGKIANINLIQWIVGHGVEPGNFADGFIGSNNSTIGDVDLVAGATGTANDFRNSVTAALNTITKVNTVNILTELAPGAIFEEVDIPANADSTLKHLYQVSTGGYIAHIVVPGAYVPVATEAYMYVDENGVVESINLLQWIVGHGVEPGDFANGFIGADNSSVGDVDIVAGATGTANDFKNAATAALTTIVELNNASQIATLYSRSSTTARTTDGLEALVPGADFEEVNVPSIADSTLKHLYSVSTGGYVAHIVVSTNLGVATEALVYVNENGEIENINLLVWNTSHESNPDGFAEGFIGADNDTVDDVELVAGSTTTSQDFKDAVAQALPVIEQLIADPDFDSSTTTDEKTESELNNLIAALIPGATFTKTDIPADSSEHLRKLYSVSCGGYVAYVVVPGAYVPVATEALIYINNSGKIENINLLQWVVGHGVGAGDFANGFIGTDIYHIEDVELVTEATGTSNDFRSAVTSVLSTVTDLMGVRESVLMGLVDDILTNSGEIVKLNLPENAPSTLIGLYTDTKNRGYVAHIIVPGAYVPVATEALVFFDRQGTIRDVKMIQWIVGHDVGYGNFESNFTGATIDTITDVEIVAGATGTSQDMIDAIAEIYPYIPVQSPTIRIVAAAALILIVTGFVTALIITRKRWACK